MCVYVYRCVHVYIHIKDRLVFGKREMYVCVDIDVCV